MKFYDLNIRGTNYSNDLALIEEANKFGWDYLNLNYSPKDYESAIEYKSTLEEEISDFGIDNTYRNKKTNNERISISMGINILNANSNEMRKITQKYRNKTSYISCLGGDLKINRAVCENRMIDVLSRPYYKRRDSGMNHVLAKEAVRNNVAVELCFRDVLKNYLKYRSKVISSFKEILMFHRKYKFPLILTTDSKNIFDIRSSRNVAGFFKSIGFTDEEVYNGFYLYPKQILDFNMNRRNIIVEGVKVIEGATDFTDTYCNKSDLDESSDFNSIFEDEVEMDLDDIDEDDSSFDDNNDGLGLDSDEDNDLNQSIKDMGDDL